MSFIMIEHTSSVNRAALLRGFQATDGIAMVQAFEDGIVATGNYRKEWQARQASWRPLDKEYFQEKTERGFSTQKWILSGATMRALGTKAKIFSTVTVAGSTRTITILQNNGYVVHVGWHVGSPAASGWPGSKQGRSFFSHNDARRPWIDKVGPDAIAATYLHLGQVTSRFWRRVFPGMKGNK